MQDRIVYEVTCIDGRDPENLQNKAETFVSFSRELAEQKMESKNTAHNTLKLIALGYDEIEKIKTAALAKLTAIERLLLNIQDPVPANEAETTLDKLRQDGAYGRKFKTVTITPIKIEELI